MLTQIGPHEYEVTHLVLDEEQSLRLEQLMNEPNADAVRCIDAAMDRARGRLSDRPIEDLVRH